jgi:hypothetical protein
MPTATKKAGVMPTPKPSEELNELYGEYRDALNEEVEALTEYRASPSAENSERLGQARKRRSDAIEAIDEYLEEHDDVPEEEGWPPVGCHQRLSLARVPWRWPF